MISKGTTVSDFIKELPGLPFDGGLTVKILRIEESVYVPNTYDLKSGR